MIRGQVVAHTKASLPQLSGRLLWTYRLIWCVLAIAAAAVFAWAILHPGMQPALFIIRLVKAIVVVAVSAILLRRRHRDPVAALLSLAFLTWAITSSFEFG